MIGIEAENLNTAPEACRASRQVRRVVAPGGQGGRCCRCWRAALLGDEAVPQAGGHAHDGIDAFEAMPLPERNLRIWSSGMRSTRTVRPQASVPSAAGSATGTAAPAADCRPDRHRSVRWTGDPDRAEPVTTLLLLRHGRTAANAGGVLAGWTPGVGLDEIGQAQAAAVAQRLRPLPVAALVSSPLQRCEETARAVLADRDGLALQLDDRFGECRYGDWTGRPLKELAKEPMWKVVQQHASAAVFPGPTGEGLADTQRRAVAAVRDWNARLGADAVWLACSHGDVIKAILADALGLHLDQFQRIVVDPSSISVVNYTETRPFVVRVNDTGGSVDALVPPKRRRGRRRSSEAVVGGGSGGPA